jgi:hypothetical protein
MRLLAPAVAMPACRRRRWPAGRPEVTPAGGSWCAPPSSLPPPLACCGLAAPLFAGVRRPPAVGRPLDVEGGEPEHGWAPCAAPDARAVIGGPYASAEDVGCGCSRLLGRRRRRSRWRAAIIGEERRSTTASRHGVTPDFP